MNSHYDTLGLLHSASQSDIKKAFRRLSLLTHPDRNRGNQDAKNKFQEINTAYNILSDDEKRKKYNEENMIDMFKKGFTPDLNFLGDHNVSSKNDYKPPPLVMMISISLEKAYNGCVMPLKIERNIRNGKEIEMVYVTIYEGIDDNEIIYLQHKGDVINNIRGDVKIFIQVTNETKFRRVGLDLIYTKDVSLKESLCGFSFDFVHLNENTYKIESKKGTIIDPNYQKQIDDLGIKRGDVCGKLVIKFNILFPKELSDCQVDNISRIF